MLDHTSNYFLPITFNTTYQKVTQQTNAGKVYEDVQFEYLVETYINNENTDSMKNWYYTYGYNLNDKDNNNIYFTNTNNNFNSFNKENTVINVNPIINDTNYQLLNNNNSNLINSFLPKYSEFMRIRLFIPKINIAAWGEKEEYIINTYFTFGGKKIYLSSGLSTYLNLNANEYKFINNQVYTQYLEFFIPSPYSICEDDVWSKFRSNVLNINNIINSQQVTFEILPYSLIDKNDNIHLNYVFNQSNYTWLNSNNPWYLTLSNTINKNILDVNILYPDTYLTLKNYLNNFKFYSYNNESSNVSFDINLAIYDLNGNVFWGNILNNEEEEDINEDSKKYILYSWTEDSKTEPKSNIKVNLQDLPIPLFNSWSGFQDDIVIRTFLTIHSDLRYTQNNKIYMTYPDVQLLSNRIPLRDEIFKYLINGYEYNNFLKINFNDLNEMKNINLKVINENKKEEVLLNNPTSSQIIKPVFFRAETLLTLKINKIKENISLNLNNYINKVKYFALSINGNIIKESGRSGSNIIFNIPGDTIWSQLKNNGDINKFTDVNNTYLLNQDGDIITSGKYLFR